MGKVEFAAGLSLILLAAYFVWGVYLLHLRFNRSADVNPVVEAGTLGILIVFYAFEFALLGIWLEHNPVLLGVSTLGLALSGCALYGPMVLSLVSHAVVGVILPSGQAALATPHFGPAEQYERAEDFESALKEYMNQYAAFPGDSATALRIGDVLVKMERYEEAVEWFRRGVEGVLEPEAALATTNRIVELCLRHLERPEMAEAALEGYVKRFRRAETAAIAERRLQRIRAGGGMTGHDLTFPPPTRVETLPEIADEPDREDEADEPSSEVIELENGPDEEGPFQRLD